ncbi:MAG TPA: AgmX/PglI C-terminal domain-containing protein [Bdellovibrionales bacterium]|nr:AgmX/PglI C-terminal domain-containing protein [Bdellovibrionales bacterium]
MRLVGGWLIVVGLSGCAGLPVEEMSVSGVGLSRAAVEAVVQDHAIQTRHCYENRLRDKPRLKGAAVLRWTVNMKGVTEDVNVKRGLDEKVDECLLAAVRSWTFPAPSAREKVLVTYPFVFAPVRGN